VTGVVSGQSATYKTIPTAMRDNFSARVCFHTSPTSSQVVLDTRDAVNLKNKGRALVQLPGRDVVEIQNPWIERDAFLRVLQTGKPANETPAMETDPTVEDVDDTFLADDDRVRRIVGAGFSLRQASLQVYGGDGGAAYRKAKAAIDAVVE
jgi:DNA segregation ATPase FtsK/SpoIIIE-like protein